MSKESFPADDVGKNGATPPTVSNGSAVDPGESNFIERRSSDRRTAERRVEERRAPSDRREDEERRGDDRRFLTMAELEANAETSDRRREAGLWPSLDWRPGDKRATQRRASERRIDDRREDERRKRERRARGRRKSDVREDLYHGQIQLEEDIDDLFEAGEYKGSSD